MRPAYTASIKSVLPVTVTRAPTVSNKAVCLKVRNNHVVCRIGEVCCSESFHRLRPSGYACHRCAFELAVSEAGMYLCAMVVQSNLAST
jgi:hypothetical protein